MFSTRPTTTPALFTAARGLRPTDPINRSSSTNATKTKSAVVPARSTDSYLGVGVPGTVMGFATALEKYGTMKLKDVIAPTIALAREGYVLQQGDVNILNDSVDDFAKHPNVAAIFLNKGKPFVAGERLQAL